MAISSPRVVQANPRGSAVQHTNAPAQFAQHMQQRREFTSRVGLEFANMAPDDRIMIARQNPDLVSNILKETNLSGREADELTTQMAEGMLSAEGQQRVNQAIISSLGGYTGQQQQQQPQQQQQQAEPQQAQQGAPRYQPDINQPGVQQGQQTLPAQGQSFQSIPNPAVRGGQVGANAYIGPTAEGQGAMQVETYDPNTPEGQFFNYMGSLFRPAGSGDTQPVKITDIVNAQEGTVNYDEFQRAFPTPESDEWQQKFPDMTQDQYTRLRAHADIQMQRAAEETKSQVMSPEDLMGAGRRFVQPEQINAQNLESSWMFDDNITAAEVREIQGQDISPGDMFGQYLNRQQQKTDEKFFARAEQETTDYSREDAQSVQNLTDTMNTGQSREASRRIEKAQKIGGELELNENMSEEQLRQYTRAAEQALGYMDRAKPRNPEQARRRANAALDYAQSSMETFTGATGQEAFVEARNFLSGNAYLEAQLAIEQNKNEMQRMLAEHDMSMDEMEMALKVQAFELDAAYRQGQAGVENVDQAKALMGQMRQSAEGLLPEDTAIADMDPADIGRLYDRNPAFRTAWSNYMKAYEQYLQMNGFNVSIQTEDIQYGGFLGIGSSTAQFPTVDTPQAEGGGMPEGLSERDTQLIQSINSSIGR